MNGNINEEYFDQYTYLDEGKFPGKKQKPAPEDPYYAYQVRQNHSTKFDRPNPDYCYGNEYGRPHHSESYLDGFPTFPEEHRGGVYGAGLPHSGHSGNHSLTYYSDW